MAKRPSIHKVSFSSQLTKFHRPLAMMVCLHAMLYEQLSVLIWLLIGGERSTAEAALSRIESFNARALAFSQAAHIFFRPKKPQKKPTRNQKRIKAIVKELQGLNIQRNNIFHGKWLSFGPDTIIVAKYSTYKLEMHYNTHHFTPKQIDQISRSMFRLHRRLKWLEALVGRSRRRMAK